MSGVRDRPERQCQITGQEAKSRAGKEGRCMVHRVLTQLVINSRSDDAKDISKNARKFQL
jgi:hypothetical protein